MSGYLKQSDLQSALGPGTFLNIFDDDNDGTVILADENVAQVLALAHAEVISYLPDVYAKLPPETPSGIVAGNDTIPVLLKSAELTYAIVFAIDRHPEFAKTYGLENRDALWKRAEAKMDRLRKAIQQIAATDSPPEPAPGNTGGIVRDSGPRVFIDSADGTHNGGDFG